MFGKRVDVSVQLMCLKDDLSNLSTPTGHLIAPPMYFKLRPSIHSRADPFFQSSYFSSNTKSGTCNLQTSIEADKLLRPQEMGNSPSKVKENRHSSESERVQAVATSQDLGSCSWGEGKGLGIVEVDGKETPSEYQASVSVDAEHRAVQKGRLHKLTASHPTKEKRASECLHWC